MRDTNKNLLIWGTCVTRDAIAVNQYADITFITRTSLASLGSAATDRFDSHIEDSKLSGWQQKAVKTTP